MLANRFGACAVILAGMIASPRGSQAQQVVVQQPAFQQLAAPTTVLVPDRGETFLGGSGGVGHAQTCRPCEGCQSTVVKGDAGRPSLL
jgi:hypothetical protein